MGLKIWSHWIDVCWFTIMIALSSGTKYDLLFWFLLFYSGCFISLGFASGLKVTIVSVIIVT